MQKNAYLAKLIYGYNKASPFFRNMLHCCDPTGQVIGVWGNVNPDG
jgi:hypothetical protein